MSERAPGNVPAAQTEASLEDVAGRFGAMADLVRQIEIVERPAVDALDRWAQAGR